MTSLLCRLLGHTWTDRATPAGETWRVCLRCDELAWQHTAATCGHLEEGHDPNQAIAVMDAHRCQTEP